MDGLVIILAVATYIFDLVKDFFASLFTPWFLAAIFFWLFWRYFDIRLDRIDKNLAEIQNRLAKRL